MQEVHLVVQLHAIASGIAVHVSRRGSLLWQGSGHNLRRPPLGHKIVARIVLDVLVVRLNLACVHITVQRLRLVAGLGSNLGQRQPCWLVRMDSLLRRRQYLVLVAGCLRVIGGRFRTGLHGFIGTLRDSRVSRYFKYF